MTGPSSGDAEDLLGQFLAHRAAPTQPAAPAASPRRQRASEPDEPDTRPTDEAVEESAGGPIYELTDEPLDFSEAEPAETSEAASSAAPADTLAQAGAVLEAFASGTLNVGPDAEPRAEAAPSVEGADPADPAAAGAPARAVGGSEDASRAVLAALLGTDDLGRTPPAEPPAVGERPDTRAPHSTADTSFGADTDAAAGAPAAAPDEAAAFEALAVASPAAPAEPRAPRRAVRSDRPDSTAASASVLAAFQEQLARQESASSTPPEPVVDEAPPQVEGALPEREPDPEPKGVPAASTALVAEPASDPAIEELVDEPSDDLLDSTEPTLIASAESPAERTDKRTDERTDEPTDESSEAAAAPAAGAAVPQVQPTSATASRPEPEPGPEPEPEPEPEITIAPPVARAQAPRPSRSRAPRPEPKVTAPRLAEVAASPAPGPSATSSAPPAVPNEVFFRPRRMARALVALILLVFVGASALACWWAYHDRTLVPVGIAATVLIATGIVWATRAGSTVARLSVKGGRLEITRDGTRTVFDLANPYTDITVQGTPGRRGWRVLFGRRGLPPFVVDSSMVSPTEFMRVLDHYRHPQDPAA